MKVLCVIPARYKSSRFPGKPLANIGGKPMVVRVYERIQEKLPASMVATDSNKIKEACIKHNIPCVITRSDHATGTDRLAEVADRYTSYDVYINVQGDEPFLPLDSIDPIIEAVTTHQISNGMAKITNPDDIEGSIPKVVFDKKQFALYLSRLPIPAHKGEHKGEQPTLYKQVCIYGFSRESLLKFQQWERGPLERSEDIEILRFIEHNYPVKMVEVPTGSIAVDTPEDLVKANELWQKTNSNSE